MKQFQQSGKLLQGGLLEQARLQYGGSAGQTAVSRYGQGFNTVTDQLLAGTRAAMDAAFRTERTGILDILKKAAGDITRQVGDITRPIEDQFTVLSTNIQTAFQTAAAAAIAELDRILAKIEEIKTATKDIVPVPETPESGEPVPTVAPSANPTFTTPALPNGTWYFAVTAYNTAGTESGYSNEVSKAIVTAPAPPKSLRIWILQALICLGQHMRFWA